VQRQERSRGEERGARSEFIEDMQQRLEDQAFFGSLPDIVGNEAEASM
jgi:hypothetical protein